MAFHLFTEMQDKSIFDSSKISSILDDDTLKVFDIFPIINCNNELHGIGISVPRNAISTESFENLFKLICHLIELEFAVYELYGGEIITRKSKKYLENLLLPS